MMSGVDLVCFGVVDGGKVIVIFDYGEMYNVIVYEFDVLLGDVFVYFLEVNVFFDMVVDFCSCILFFKYICVDVCVVLG